MNKQVKKGQVIKNYLGEFAKVINVKNGFFYLSPWVRKEEIAKVAVNHSKRLNAFGLSDAMETKADNTETKPVKEAEKTKADKPKNKA